MSDTKSDIKKLPIVPLVYNYSFRYQSVNKDEQLRRDVTEFFINKIIKWIAKYDEFKHLENKVNFYKTYDGEKEIYHLIRKFVNKYRVNWYELRTTYYHYVKKFLLKNL